MSDDFGEEPELAAMARRLKDLVKKAGGNQRVADAADVPLSTLNTILAGKSDPRVSTLRKLAPALGIPISGLMEIVFDGENTVNQMLDSMVRIPMRNVYASAGPGIENGDEPIIGHLTFPKEIVATWGRNPARIEAVQGHGDSMYPTIADNQWILIDRADRDLVDGRVYGFRTEDGFRVKRFQKRIDGTPMLVSDNRELYAPEPLSKASLRQILVAGRVFLAPRMI